jgi:ABC-type bacteriocin/lantibiotic exporter with double-glycine peptidase domain
MSRLIKKLSNIADSLLGNCLQRMITLLNTSALIQTLGFFDRVMIWSASGHMCCYIYIFFYLMCFTSWAYDPAALGCAGAFTLSDRSLRIPGQYFLLYSLFLK